MARTGRFVIKKAGGGYMFELQASNYSSIAESPVYTTFESAKRSIRSIMDKAHSVPVQDNAVEEVVKYPNPKFEIFRQDAFYFFRFRAGNGKMTISSQVYTSKDGCKNGVNSVQENVSDAAVCVETPDGIISLEEYSELEEKRIAEGGDPTVLNPEDDIDFDAPDDEQLTEEEKSTRPGRFVIYKDERGFRFELLAANFSSIADSPVYSTLDSAKRSINSIKEYAHGVPVQDNTVEKIEKKPNPKFEVFNEGDEYFFRFRAKNGKQTIFSQVYATKDGCRNGVESVQKHVMRSDVYIETEDGCMPMEEYTAVRVAIFNASVFKKTSEMESTGKETIVEPLADPATEKMTTPETVAPVAATPLKESAPAPEKAEAPIENTPVAEASVEETPAEETPVEETPAEEAPVEETLVEETPAVEAPVEETHAEETPAEETPAEETPAEETPAEETPAEEALADEIPLEVIADEDAPAAEQTAYPWEAATDETPAESYDDSYVQPTEEVKADKKPAPVKSAANKKPGFGHFLRRMFLGKD